MADSTAPVDRAQERGISRRTLMKGTAWAAPAIVVAVAAPIAAASNTKLPCVGDIQATGGTYPVAVDLSGCSTNSSHWDFNFKITTKPDVDCTCNYVRITFYDNPKRSRLWFDGSNSNNSPQLYVQKVLPIGATGTFPTTGDVVKQVSNGATIGTITAPGSTNDSLHTLYLPGGSIPCSASGSLSGSMMATYKVECGDTADGPWTQVGGLGQINPCVPMIQSTVCRASSSGNGSYTLGISILNACGIDPSSFKITNVQRSNSNVDPTQGTSVWSTGQTLGSGTTNITTGTNGSGSYLWISFTTDNGANVSRILVSTTNTNCSR